MSRCHNVLALIPREGCWDGFLEHVQDVVRAQGREFLVVRTEGIAHTAENLPGLFYYIEEILNNGPISAITCFVATEYAPPTKGKEKGQLAEVQAAVFAAIKNRFGSKVSSLGVFVHWDRGHILQIDGDAHRIPWLHALRMKCGVSSPEEKRARCA